MRKKQICPELALEETVSYEDFITMRSNDQSIYYDTLSQGQLSPTMEKGKVKLVLERREALRNPKTKPRSKSFDSVHNELKPGDLNFTLD